MKNILFISVIISLFIGCGSSGGGTTTPTNDNNDTNDSHEDNTTIDNNSSISSDIILKKGDSLVCTTATPFSVEPTDKPLVNFSKNIENGEITITMDKESRGFITVIGCTKK